MLIAVLLTKYGNNKTNVIVYFRSLCLEDQSSHGHLDEVIIIYMYM